MYKKVYIILSNFLKSSTIKELFEIFVLPVPCIILIYAFLNSKIADFITFSQDFNNTIITITALLAAFGLASISILITSSSSNVTRAIKTYTKRLDRNKKPVSYYKLQIYRSFFSLIIQVFVLIISIIYKFLGQTAFNLTFVFYGETYLLIVSILSQLLTIVGMYFLFANPEN